ncbi:MAG: hypothetical protein GF364_08335, partial [Candidatus Lokiarchaeota archaeon]|nr:hypothetical protein [Candidatus Lokiarchaeota archaeon]
MILEIAPLAKLLWEILEVVIFVLFIVQGVYFLRKYFKEKDGELESIAQIDLGYAVFFFMITLNQFIYLADYDLWNLFPILNQFFTFGEYEIFFYIGDLSFGLDHQIYLMIVLFFYGFTPIMYPLEKYIMRKEKTPIFKMSLISTIILTGIYIWIFVIGRALAPAGFSGDQILWQGEIDTLPGNIINIIFLIVALFGMITLLQEISNFVQYYLDLAVKSPKGPLKTKALLIFFGFCLFYGALVIGNGTKHQLDEFLNGWLILI